MKTGTLRAVDRFVGVPVCALLTLHRKSLGGPAPDGPIRRIIFVKLAEQGATVLAAEALGRATAMVGRQNVFFLAFEENRFVLDVMGLIPRENVITLDSRTFLSAAVSAVRALRRMRALRIDAAVNLEFFARASAILSYLSGARLRSGLHSYAGEGPYCGDLMTHRVVYNPHVHTSQLFSLMAEALGQPAADFPAFAVVPPRMPSSSPACVCPADDLEAMRRLIAQVAGSRDSHRLILLNANCSDMLPLRKWPKQSYVQLARRLLAARPEVLVLLTGAPDEAGEIDGLAAQIGDKRCASVAGRTTLSQLLALYSLADVLVTNDSGAAHFAAMTSVDVITLFGPETPALFAPVTPRGHVFWTGLACSPCVNALNNRVSRCHRNICMERITVDQVLERTLAAYVARCGLSA